MSAGGTPDPIDWNVAAGKICDAMNERATQVATRASEDLYEHMMLSVQDYLRANVDFNLSSELRSVSAERDRLRASNALLLEALRDMVSDHECLSAATLQFARLAIARAEGRPHG